MTDIKQLKAELAQAKKDLKAEEKRTKKLKQFLLTFADRINECEDIFSLVLALDEDYRDGQSVDIPARDMRYLVREINAQSKLNTKAFQKIGQRTYDAEV